MHPEILRALAKARHDDLLDECRTRAHARVRHDHRAPRFVRARQGVGSLFLWAGARLIGEHGTSSSWPRSSAHRQTSPDLSH
jgi:hypothetical protein